MKKTTSTILFILFVLQLTFAQTASTTAINTGNESSEIEKLLKSYEKKIYFTQNDGQFSPGVLYRADFSLGQAIVTQQGMLISTYDPALMHARQEEGHQIEEDIKNGLPARELSARMKGHTWMMNFVNSSPSMKITGKDKHTDAYNYFSGGVSLTSVTNYGEIWYNNVYNNVDVRYYPSADGTLEYDIICKPGFRGSDIAIRFDGIDRMTIDPNGHLVLHTSVGDVDFPAPVVYQKVDGVEKSVQAAYKISGNELGFELGAYDNAQPLIIDPIALRWATWVNTNSSGDNHGHCIWVDPNDGAIYVVARVVGTTDQITVGAFDVTANGNLETIVGKYLEPAVIGGSGTRVWQTYIGGNGDDNPYAMEQGPDSNLYITGYTSSTNFPLIGGTAFNGGGASIDDQAQSGQDIFIMKINRDGNSIKSAIVGGNGTEGSFDLRISNNGDIVINGSHTSSNLATVHPGIGASNTVGGTDVLVFKINQDLSALSWIKNYGGSGTDAGTIMVQNNTTGEIFQGGYTTSANFPVTANARQSTGAGTQSGFLQKLDASGNTLWSSYFQSASGVATAILCMEFNTTKNQLYFGGITGGLAASNISASGVYDNTYNTGTNDFFVCRMDTNQNFVASTYIGGSGNEVNMMGLNTDLNNDVFVFGYTNSTNFPTSVIPNTALQTSNLGLNDKVFLKLNSTLSTLIFSTYYGGAADDYDPVGERGIKFSNCRIYTIVTSKSNNIPLTQGAINTTRISTTPYEPGLVVWANPPDITGNTINDDQIICAGQTPQDIIGSVPAYALPTIIRNGVTSAYPSLGSAATYQWQTSTDSVNWADMPGQNGQNLSGAAIGPLFAKTFFRRIIGGDACVLAGAADQVVTVKVVSVTADVTNVLCDGTGFGSITANSDGQAPFDYLWSTAATTQTINNLTTGTYTVTVTDFESCSASGSFSVTVNQSASVSISGLTSLCGGSSTQLSADAGFPGYNWSTGATTQNIIVSTAGTFTVTVTAANGCTASASATTSINQTPSCSITGSNFCYGYSSQICAAAAPVGYTYSYLWSTAATTQCVTLTVGGTYTVTITDQNGCTSSCSKTVIAYSPPTCSITGSNFCNGSSSQLCASTNSGYLWNTGATTQCITVSAGGTYTVTVSDGNGCTSSCSKTVIAYTPPTCAITGSLFYCQGGTTQICAPAGLSGYLWNTGTTVQCITVTAGDYTVSVTDGNGCSSSCTAVVTERPNPVCSITGSNFCYGYSSQICAAAAPVGYTYSYNWSSGATTQCVTLTVGGTYTVTITDQYGCSSSCSKTVIAYSPPTCSITGSNFCNGSSSQLCASTNSGYLWNTGATTQCITVSAGGTYTVTVSDGNGCTSSCSKTVIAYTPPTCAITGSLFYCQGGTTQICAPAGLSGYLWNTGATTQCITVTAGDYTVSVTDGNGCSSSCTAVVTERPNPVCSITGSNFCYGYSSQICAAAAPVGYTYSYLWSTSATTQCVTLTVGGTYTVTITDQYGCSSSCSKTVIAYTPPTCSITGGNFCYGSSTQLCAATNAGYLWSTGATTQCVTVTTGGTYTVTVTDGNGCTSSCSKTVIAYTSPTCAITGNFFYCAGGSTQICAPAGLVYIWNTGATTQCITTTSGNYTVTVTDANGCSSSCSANVTERPNPVCSITGSNFCYGYSSQICAAAAPVGYTYSYLWSTAATTQCVTLTVGGTYTVTITDQYGCSSSCSKTVIAYSPPTCSITGSNFCNGSSSQLCAATNSGYLWSTGATTQCVTVTTGGTYTVTVTDGNGCTNSCSKTVIAYTSPTCAITGNFFYCAGGSTQICAPAGLVYIWNTGATTQCITTTAGNYTVTVTDANGCSSSCSANVTERPNPVCSITGSNFCYGYSSQICAAAAPVGYTYSYLWSTAATTQCVTLTVGGTYTVTITDQYGCSSSCSKTVIAYSPPTCSITGSNFCNGSSSQLCAATNSGYLWSTGATTQCITVTAGGTYTVTVTDGNGCTNSCSKTVIAYQAPSSTITGSGSVCSGGSTQWCAPSGLAGYLWSTGATTQCVVVNTANTFTVTVTDANGCTSSSSKSLTVNQVTTCTITGSANVCSGSSTQWCAAAGQAVYLWSTGATTQCIIVSTAGTYTVTTTNDAGCISTCNKTLTVRNNPNCLISGAASVCPGSSAQWCAPAGLSAYLWSTGATTQCITVGSAGTYTVTTTNSFGCTSSCNKTLTIKNVPSCLITGSSSVCQGNSAQWCAPAGLAGYLWNTGATTQCVTLSSSGTYTVTTTNAGGCTSSCSKTLSVNTLPSCLITGNSSVCAGKSTQWCAPDGTGPYLWSTGATSKCITVSTAGTYTVTTTGSGGCTSSCSKTLTVNPVPSCTITGNGSVCAGFSTQWCAPAGLSGYLWSTGATTQCVTVSTAGTYTVTTTNSSGCTSSCNKTLVVNTNNVTITANGPTTYCDYDPNLTLCASAGVNYIWDTGATTQCVLANLKTHLYVVTVTDANGCVGTASQQVIENLLPTVSITAPSTLPICGLTGNILTGNTAAGNSYAWTVSSSDNSWVINSGASTSSISYRAGNPGICGAFTLTATVPATGCKQTATITVCSSCEEHCGYSQAFYGSPTGVSCDGLTKTQLLTNLLPNTLVSGAAARTVSILSSEVSCLIDKMPSKSNPNALPVGNVTCATAIGTAYLNSGQFKHALLGEAIALGLNLRLDPSLSNLVMSGPYMTTYKANNCTGGKAVNGTKLVFAIPQSVLNYISSPKTVGKLLLLANQALGATYVPSGSNPTIAEIDSACKAINTGFDKCRILAGFGTSSAGVRSQDQLQQLQLESSIQVNAYPNPFNSEATIEFISDEKASHTTVDIYSLAGDKISNIFESDIEAGTIYKAEFNARNLGEGIYIYRIISGDKIVNGKLILIK